MDSKVKLRLKWIKFYKETVNAGVVCEHYSISRFTLRKWLKRHDEQGEAGLIDANKKPRFSPLQKRNEINEQLIIQLREERKLGARRLQNELKRLHDISFSLSTIHKVFKKYNVPHLKQKRHYSKKINRYNCQTPGERVQMDVCKIAEGLYQYTAIDDCTRYKVIALYSRRTAKNTIDFLYQVKARMPFYMQTMQTDRGKEFFAYEVQDLLKEWKIKFRPIKPASPHLNGKVERTQRTDLDEFYSSVTINDPDLAKKLQDWEEYYNNNRSHGSLGNKTPFEKYKTLENKTLSQQEVEAAYDLSKERLVVQNYAYDQVMKAFKKGHYS